MRMVSTSTFIHAIDQKLGRIKSDFIKCVGSKKFNSCFYRNVEYDRVHMHSN